MMVDAGGSDAQPNVSVLQLSRGEWTKWIRHHRCFQPNDVKVDHADYPP